MCANRTPPRPQFCCKDSTKSHLPSKTRDTHTGDVVGEQEGGEGTFRCPWRAFRVHDEGILCVNVFMCVWLKSKPNTGNKMKTCAWLWNLKNILCVYLLEPIKSQRDGYSWPQVEFYILNACILDFGQLFLWLHFKGCVWMWTCLQGLNMDAHATKVVDRYSFLTLTQIKQWTNQCKY